MPGIQTCNLSVISPQHPFVCECERAYQWWWPCQQTGRADWGCWSRSRCGVLWDWKAPVPLQFALLLPNYPDPLWPERTYLGESWNLHTNTCIYISNLSPSLPLLTQVKLWFTYFQTCCHTEKHWRNLIGCQSLWGHFHWRWLGRSTQRAHRGRLQGAWRSDGSGALVDLWGSPDFPGYCHALSCPKKKIRR